VLAFSLFLLRLLCGRALAFSHGRPRFRQY
jgi:hypothetical protein